MRTFFAAFVISCFFMATSMHAQGDREQLDRIMQSDSDMVDVIATAQEDVRASILTASTAAEAVARLSALQESAQTRFEQKAQAYAREIQAAMWNVSRYDDLLSRSAAGPVNGDDYVRFLQKFPVDVRTSAILLRDKAPATFAEMNAVRVQYLQEEEQLLAGYPDSVRRAFVTLHKAPEVLSLMDENMRSTVLIGDLYRRDPVMLLQALNERSMTLTARKAKDVAEWKEKIISDTAAQSEFQGSADEFAREQGAAQGADVQEEPKVRDVVYVAPYAVWSGYPMWYTTPVWYPYPVWYQCGYYRLRGVRVWWGMPSWMFLRWHFHRYPRVRMYPCLTNLYLDFWVFGPPRTFPWCRRETRWWYRTNARYLPPRFPFDRARRISDIREIRPPNEVVPDRRRPRPMPPVLPRSQQPGVPIDRKTMPSRQPDVHRVAPSPPAPPRRVVPDVPRTPRPDVPLPRTPAPSRQPDIPQAPPTPPRAPRREVPDVPRTPQPATRPAPSNDKPERPTSPPSPPGSESWQRPSVPDRAPTRPPGISRGYGTFLDGRRPRPTFNVTPSLAPQSAPASGGQSGRPSRHPF